MKKTMPSDEKAQLLLDTIEDRKAVDPVMLDLREKVLVADFFLVCSGTSHVHIRALSDAVLEKVDEVRLPKPRIEGQEIGEWVLLDFGDVVLHIMGEEQRERYKLEQFWSTTQPKGALPPTPGSVTGDDDIAGEDDFDEDDLDEEEMDDEAFFSEADEEVEPIDEDDLDDAPQRRAQ